MKFFLTLFLSLPLLPATAGASIEPSTALLGLVGVVFLARRKR